MSDLDRLAEPDRAWADAVVAACAPVFDAAGVGFVWQCVTEPDGRLAALLWEADPRLFDARYPDAGLRESYGSQFDEAPCIDYWIHVDLAAQTARLNVEGWSLPEVVVPLSGHPSMDAARLAALVARLLGVRREGP